MFVLQQPMAETNIDVKMSQSAVLDVCLYNMLWYVYILTTCLFYAFAVVTVLRTHW